MSNRQTPSHGESRVLAESSSTSAESEQPEIDDQDNPRREPEQRRSRERVERVLDAAATLIETDGIDAITMSRLAEAANVSLPSIYRYFPSKRAILRTLLDRYRERMLEQVAAELGRPESAEDLQRMIRDGLIRFWEYTKQEPAYVAIWAAGFADPEFSQIIVDSLFDIGTVFANELEGRVIIRPGDEVSFFMATYLTAAMARVANSVDDELAGQLMDRMMNRVFPALVGLEDRIVPTPPE